MNFQYETAVYPPEMFTALVFFCTGTGECKEERIPKNEIQALDQILNDRGRQGFDLVHLSFTEKGILTIWKREIVEGNP